MEKFPFVHISEPSYRVLCRKVAWIFAPKYPVCRRRNDPDDFLLFPNYAGMQDHCLSVFTAKEGGSLPVSADPSSCSTDMATRADNGSVLSYAEQGPAKPEDARNYYGSIFPTLHALVAHWEKYGTAPEKVANVWYTHLLRHILRHAIS
jgi:hypothetical protein